MFNKGKSIVKIIKNNGLKISAISVLLIMLISIVWIIKPDEEMNIVGETVELNYTVVYNAANNVFYKNTVGGTPITQEELAILKMSGSKVGEVSTITLNGTNIKSTTATVLSIVGEATLNIADGTKNYIEKTGDTALNKKSNNIFCDVFSDAKFR